MSTSTAHRTLKQRLARCMSVSVITTVISVSTLTLAMALFGVTAWIANVIATSVATGPSYTLNRRWTWGIRDASDPWRQVAPFWLLSFAGLGLSTLAVAIADSWAAQMQLAGVLRTGAVLGAHLSGFGLLWVVQFVLLDRVLFRPARTYTTGQTAPVRGASGERSSAALLQRDAA